MPPRQLRPATNTTAPTSCGAHSVRKPERIPTPAAGVRRGGPWSPGRLQPIHPLVDDHARLAYSKVLQRDRDGLKRPSWNELSPTSWPGASSRSNECSPTIPLAGRRPQEGARRPRHRPGTHPAARRSGQGGAEPTAPSSRNGAVAKSSPAPNRAAAAHLARGTQQGSSTTTLSAVAAHSEGAAEPADCRRRDGRVHLDHGRPLRATGPLQ